jgi:hypothetical protein
MNSSSTGDEPPAQNQQRLLYFEILPVGTRAPAQQFSHAASWPLIGLQ